MSGKLFLTDVQTLRNRARRHIDEGALTIGYNADRETVLKLLNDSLATEIVCVLRYRRYQSTAIGFHSKGIADEFVAHAREEQGHADQIAARIVQLGGEPDFSLDGLVSRSHAAYMVSRSIVDLIKEDIVAECITMDSYRDILQYLNDRDPTSYRMMAGILAVEEQHAGEMADLMESLPA